MADTANQKVARQIDADIRDPIRAQVIAPKLFGDIITLKDGKTAYTYDQLTDMEDSIVSYEIPEGSWGDGYKVTPRTVRVPYHINKYKLKRGDVNAFLSEGKDLPTKIALSAAQKNREKLETTLMNVWKPDGTNERCIGLYAAAGSTFGGGSFGTAGNPTAAVAGGKAAASANKVQNRNWHLILHPDQYGELDGSILTNGDPEMEHVFEQLNRNSNFPKGGIWESNELTTGTGLMVPVDPYGEYFSLLVVASFLNVVGVDSRMGVMSPVYGMNVTAMAPVFWQTDGNDTVAIVSITGI